MKILRKCHNRNKRHIWNHRDTNKGELQQRNRLETVSRKTTGDGGGGGGGGAGEALNLFYAREISHHENMPI